MSAVTRRGWNAPAHACWVGGRFWRCSRECFSKVSFVSGCVHVFLVSSRAYDSEYDAVYLCIRIFNSFVYIRNVGV